MTAATFDPRLLKRVRDKTKAKAKAKAGESTGEVRSATSNSMFVGLAFLIAVLNLLGLVMVLSASSFMAFKNYGNSWYHVTRQATWGLIGVAVLVGLARTDYHRWRRFAAPLLKLSLVLLVAVLIVGDSHNGSRRWVGYGALVIQPTELVKLAFLIWIADLLTRRQRLMHRTDATLVPVLVALVPMALLVLLQPNLSTTIVLVGVAMSMCFVAGVNLRAIAVFSAAGMGVLTFLAFAADYRRERLLSFLNPMADPHGEGYQNVQSMVGLASGGFSGTGLGASRSKFGYLPYAHSDFIFAIIGEELGLVGSLVVLSLFVLLGVLGIRVALHAPDRFGMLLAIGVTSWFLFQAFVNVGVVAGVLPVTGVPLPFVSYGGSSLVFSMAGAGLLLAVARRAVAPDRDKVEA